MAATWVQCAHGYVRLDDGDGGESPDASQWCTRPACVEEASQWLHGHLQLYFGCDPEPSDPEPVELFGADSHGMTLTEPSKLGAVLRVVAKALAPDRGVLDNKWQGDCTFLAWHDVLVRIPQFQPPPGITIRDHEELRSACVAHARKAEVRQRRITLGGDATMLLGDFLADTVKAWPAHVRRSHAPTAGDCNADTWCRLMGRERWWGDEGTHAVLADLTGAVAKVWHPSALGGGRRRVHAWRCQAAAVLR